MDEAYMKTVKFDGHNVVFAENQPEYLPLPARRMADCQVTSCWELDEAEMATLRQTKRIYITMHTGNGPLQPLLPSVILDEGQNYENEENEGLAMQACAQVPGLR